MISNSFGALNSNLNDPLFFHLLISPSKVFQSEVLSFSLLAERVASFNDSVGIFMFNSGDGSELFVLQNFRLKQTTNRLHQVSTLLLKQPTLLTRFFSN